MSLSRRQMLFAAGAALIGPGVAGRSFGAGKGSPKKVLFFTKSSGFQHSIITRKGCSLGLAERILTDVGKEHGFEVYASKDGRLFDPDQIGQWDAFAFVTTGDLTTMGDHYDGPPMSKDGKKALLDAIRGGKGFIGMHCADDTFHSAGKRDRQSETLDPYIEMIGGEFIVHGAQQKAKMIVADPHFPGAEPYGPSFELLDEWYAHKNLADDLHVIIAHDTKEMKGKMYERPSFPSTWARMYGKGRVFYTSMGHREEVWESPNYQGFVIAALSWVTGKVDASVEPNIGQVCPECKTLPAESN